MYRFAVDIFSGAGGLSLGAEMAGIEVRYAVEIEPFMAQTYRKNHVNVKMYCQDVQSFDIKNEIGDNRPFIVMGGPPCQGFSLSNTRDRNMANPKNHLFKEFVRIVKDLKPDWFLFENVSGITKMENGRVIEYIKECFQKLDTPYKVSDAVLRASDYGVPQNRERYFLVGNKLDIDFKFPPKEDVKITVWDAISDLPVLENGSWIDSASYTIPKRQATPYAKKMRSKTHKATQNYVSRNQDYVIKRYEHIKQGQNWRVIPEYLMKNYADKTRCHSGIYKRLKADAPSVVISNYRKSMLIHPFQNRGLSVREAARIQSFPDWFKFEGPISYKQQQIGNAVPPLLAEAVIRQIIKLTEVHGYIH